MPEFPDQLDRKIILELKKDSRRSVRQLAKAIGESPSTIYNRVKKLEEKGVIKRYSIAIDYPQLSLSVTALIFIQYASGNKDLYDKLTAEITKMEMVYEVYRISGEYNLILKVRADTIASIHSFLMNKIRALEGIARCDIKTVLDHALEEHDQTSFI